MPRSRRCRGSAWTGAGGPPDLDAEVHVSGIPVHHPQRPPGQEHAAAARHGDRGPDRSHLSVLESAQPKAAAWRFVMKRVWLPTIGTAIATLAAGSLLNISAQSSGTLEGHVKLT